MTARTNPMFTRRHYVAVAYHMVETRPPSSHTEMVYEWEAVVEELARMFGADNERFSKEKFYEACEYPVDPR